MMTSINLLVWAMVLCLGYVRARPGRSSVSGVANAGVMSMEQLSAVPGTGIFENCGNSNFSVTWTPNPLYINEKYTLSGFYVFPKNFTIGLFVVTLGDLPPEKWPIICPMVTKDGNCTKDHRIPLHKKLQVPPLPISVENVPVKLQVFNKENYEFLCAKALITIK